MERDKHDSLEEIFNVWDSERSGRGKMKVQSELTWEPAIDVIETDEELIIIVEIAGMNGYMVSGGIGSAAILALLLLLFVVPKIREKRELAGGAGRRRRPAKGEVEARK